MTSHLAPHGHGRRLALLLGGGLVAVAVAVLAIALGSLLAAGMNLLTALVGVAVGLLGFLAIGSFTTLDANWRWTLPLPDRGTTLSLALVNLTDEQPPLARIDQNFDPFTHNALGRTLKLGVATAF